MSMYDSIIHLPRPISEKHPQMCVADRAAQFAPFAALSGYGAAIRETGRLTAQKIELDEFEKAELNERLADLQTRIKSKPSVRILFFRPDERKAGGAYVDLTGAVQKIDDYAQVVIMTDGTVIPFDAIMSIT